MLPAIGRHRLPGFAAVLQARQARFQRLLVFVAEKEQSLDLGQVQYPKRHFSREFESRNRPHHGGSDGFRLPLGGAVRDFVSVVEVFPRPLCYKEVDVKIAQV